MAKQLEIQPTGNGYQFCLCCHTSNASDNLQPSNEVATSLVYVTLSALLLQGLNNFIIDIR